MLCPIGRLLACFGFHFCDVMGVLCFLVLLFVFEWKREIKGEKRKKKERHTVVWVRRWGGSRRSSGVIKICYVTFFQLKNQECLEWDCYIFKERRQSYSFACKVITEFRVKRGFHFTLHKFTGFWLRRIKIVLSQFIPLFINISVSRKVR